MKKILFSAAILIFVGNGCVSYNTSSVSTSQVTTTTARIETLAELQKKYDGKYEARDDQASWSSFNSLTLHFISGDKISVRGTALWLPKNPSDNFHDGEIDGFASYKEGEADYNDSENCKVHFIFKNDGVIAKEIVDDKRSVFPCDAVNTSFNGEYKHVSTEIK